MRRWLIRIAVAIGLLALLASLPAAAFAAPVQTPHVEAELIAENTALQPGQPQNWLALRLPDAARCSLCIGDFLELLRELGERV